ncbi:MAG: hypothetical protein HOK24_15085 [Desulfobacula sp.]|uniref:hypothetical protein n=1 Tax=Desulfobacula sp. TaxID=2593537 RepID=UPI001D1FA0B6|nr:hypothetical protein [Desulfobacula sp.]MBT4201198.1 hypothetical protein [Desulfobacula sp.]MBT4506614.1 hypothetical protein [Desulfobacula sp.]MBT4876948.1 hypothetical protein [Desulfobacula sp.]MBT5545785.1 hypothetical protein [Desulfobacula sp.]
MTTTDQMQKKPLWLEIEENLLELNPGELSGQAKETAIQKIIGDLDNAGFNVSKSGGKIMQLRWAMDDMLEVGRPLMKDFNDAISALSLEDVLDPYSATTKLIDNIGATWKEFWKVERRPDIIRIVEETRLDLLVKKAKELSENESIRYLILEQVEREVIVNKLGITEEKLAGVEAQIAKEKAEKKRVAKLLEKVAGKSEEEKVKHLITNNVAEELIIEMAEVDQVAINNAKKAMEEEIKEKQRLAEEAAAKKKAEAAGPSLEDITPDDMIDHIDAIREIMEFSEVEKEIRTMCEQSSIPQCLVDIAVSDPDKLDELEKKAEG